MNVREFLNENDGLCSDLPKRMAADVKAGYLTVFKTDTGYIAMDSHGGFYRTRSMLEMRLQDAFSSLARIVTVPLKLKRVDLNEP